MAKIEKEPTGNMQPMPPFKTLGEEAEYWDTHSLVDEMDEHTNVALHRKEKSETLVKPQRRRPNKLFLYRNTEVCDNGKQQGRSWK